MIQSLSINTSALLSAMPLVDILDYQRVPIIVEVMLGEDVLYMPVALCRMIVEIGISRTWHRTSSHHVIFADVHKV